MKTLLDDKKGIENFEKLASSEMQILLGGGDDKYKIKNTKERDVFDPDEH